MAPAFASASSSAASSCDGTTSKLQRRDSCASCVTHTGATHATRHHREVEGEAHVMSNSRRVHRFSYVRAFVMWCPLLPRPAAPCSGGLLHWIQNTDTDGSRRMEDAECDEESTLPLALSLPRSRYAVPDLPPALPRASTPQTEATSPGACVHRSFAVPQTVADQALGERTALAARRGAAKRCTAPCGAPAALGLLGTTRAWR